MAKELKSFIMSYSVSYEIKEANIKAAVKVAKKHCATIPNSTNASVVDESTGEEVFL